MYIGSIRKIHLTDFIIIKNLSLSYNSESNFKIGEVKIVSHSWNVQGLIESSCYECGEKLEYLNPFASDRHFFESLQYLIHRLDVLDQIEIGSVNVEVIYAQKLWDILQIQTNSIIDVFNHIATFSDFYS